MLGILFLTTQHPSLHTCVGDIRVAVHQSSAVYISIINLTTEQVAYCVPDQLFQGLHRDMHINIYICCVH